MYLLCVLEVLFVREVDFWVSFPTLWDCRTGRPPSQCCKNKAQTWTFLTNGTFKRRNESPSCPQYSVLLYPLNYRGYIQYTWFNKVHMNLLITFIQHLGIKKMCDWVQVFVCVCDIEWDRGRIIESRSPRPLTIITSPSSHNWAISSPCRWGHSGFDVWIWLGGK